MFEAVALVVGLWARWSGSVGVSRLSVACEEIVAGAAIGLGAAMLVCLLDLLLSLCVFLAAQLADEGSADPSPLSLRLISSS